MKRFYSNLFMTLFFAILSTSIYAQNDSLAEPTFAQEYLGIHCYVSVDLKNDPVENGYLKYTIPVPREGVDFIQGPAGSYLLNNLGNTVDVYVRRSHLELALADMPYAQVPFELFVHLWKSPNGSTSTFPDPTKEQCFYYVVFNMTTL